MTFLAGAHKCQELFAMGNRREGPQHPALVASDGDRLDSMIG